MSFFERGVGARKESRVLFCLGIVVIMAILTAGFACVKHITVVADGKTHEMTTTCTRPDRALHEAGIHLDDKDEFSMSTQYLEDGTEIRVHRAVLLTIEQGDSARIVRTGKQTVGEVLHQYGYDLKKATPVIGEETPVKAYMNIRLMTPEEIAAQEERAEKERAARAEEARAARERSIETSRGYMRYSQMLVMEASAYLPTDGGGAGITATGLPARHGVVAVDPDVIPLGSRVYIPGYGLAIAADTGGMIEGHMIDLCMDDYNSAIEFGRRDIEVYILEE